MQNMERNDVAAYGYKHMNRQKSHVFNYLLEVVAFFFGCCLFSLVMVVGHCWLVLLT